MSVTSSVDWLSCACFLVHLNMVTGRISLSSKPSLKNLPLWCMFNIFRWSRDKYHQQFWWAGPIFKALELSESQGHKSGSIVKYLQSRIEGISDVDSRKNI